MDKKFYLFAPFSDAPPPAVSAEVQQFFDRLITPPTIARQALYATAIDTLVSGGVWAKLDVLRLWAAEDSNTSLTNLTTGAYKGGLIFEGGTPVFTVDQGWVGGGVTSALDSNFNPVAAAGNYSQDDAMIGVWNLQIGQSAGSMCYFEGGAGYTKIKPRTASDEAAYDINSDGSDITVSGVTDASGWWVAERTAPNACSLRRNNVTIDTDTVASQSVDNAKFILLGGAGREGAAVAIGSSLTSGEHTTLYTVISDYLTAVGAI